MSAVDDLGAATGNGSIGTDELAALATAFRRDGFVVLSGLLDEPELAALEVAMAALQRDVASGAVDRSRYGGDYLTSAVSGDTLPFVNYVKDVTSLSPEADAAFTHPTLVDLARRCLGDVDVWRFGPEHGERFGVVYQDARPGQESGYSRIGWHADHQAFPTSDFFPSVAVTFHLDGTSPANGFLRVVPGSHEWSTDSMPLGFEKVPGEIAVYCERGDIILHHCDLWHSAARATEDPPGGVRRHLRGSWNAGRRPEPGEQLEAFNKNAAR